MAVGSPFSRELKGLPGLEVYDSMLRSDMAVLAAER
jgi:hypothetical protein